MEDAALLPPISRTTRLKGRRQINAACTKQATVIALRNDGLLRPYNVAAHDAIASARRCVPLDRLLEVILASPVSYVCSKSDKLGKMKSMAAVGADKKNTAARVKMMEFTENHRYWMVSQRDGDIWIESLDC